MKDIYIKFGNPAIKGESQDKDHAHWIEASSWTHHIAQPKSATASTSGGFTAERCEHGDMVFTKDIDVGSVHIHGKDWHDKDDDSKPPKAVITPQGELVIAGKPMQATPEQHTMLVDYRQHIIGIAEAGMDIGASGADIGVAAAKQALWGALSGKSDKEIEASIKPQTDKIEAAAARLCQRLPGLLSAQQKLAAAMPEFRPYATMQQKDVDDCGKDMADKNGVAVSSD